MRSISELKKSARNSLKGYWGTVVISYLIYFLISFVIGCIPIINFISAIVIIPAIVIGLNYQIFNLCLGNEISVKDMFSNSKLMIKSILFNLLLSFYLLSMFIGIIIIWNMLPSFGQLILGISSLIGIMYISIRMNLSYFVIIDNEDMRIVEIFKESFRITKNYCIKITLMYLSFILDLMIVLIGVTALSMILEQAGESSLSIILNILCIMILPVCMMPYFTTTNAKLYLDIKEQSNNI